MEGTRDGDIGTLPLPPSVLELLKNAGFSLISEVTSMRPMELAREIQVDVEIAANIIEKVSTPVHSGSSALDILLKSSQEMNIITFCKSIDRLIGGGIPCGQLTEVCGVPGVGKTQLGIQLAVDVQIPKVFKGRGGEAVYIDTEGSFMVERVAEVAEAVAQHLTRIALHCPSDSPKALAAKAISTDALMQGIHVFRALDQTELMATLHYLPAFLAAHPTVKLVVIDSIAFHFRQDLQDLPSRNRILSSVAQSLHKCLADNCALSVVLVNHVTTKLDKATGRSQIVPALGDMWSHCVTNRLMLQWKGGQRVAYLVKSPDRPHGSAPYAVTSLGIRDVTSSAAGSLGVTSQLSQYGQHPHPQQVAEGGHLQGTEDPADKRQRVT